MMAVATARATSRGAGAAVSRLRTTNPGVCIFALALLACLPVSKLHAQSTSVSNPAPKAAGQAMVGGPTPIPQVPDAGTSTTYTLPQLIDMAERANPLTRIAWERTRQAADRTVVARGPLFPIVALTTNAIRGDLLFGLPPNIASEGVVKLNSSIVIPAVRLTWTPIDFGSSLATYRAAKETQVATNEEATATEQQVALTVSQDYYALVAATQAQQSAEASYAAAKVQDAATELSYVEGLISVIKRDQVKAQTLSTYANLVSAKAQLQQAKVALATDVDLSAEQAFNVPPLGDEINTQWVSASVEDLVKTAIQRRPELREALDQIKAAQQLEKSAHADLFPTVSIDAEEQYTHGTSSTAATGSALAAASNPDTNGDTYVIAASFKWDIFTAGAKRAHVRDTASEVRQSQIRLDQLTLDVQQQVWQSYTDVETALSQQQAAEAALLAAREYSDAAKLATAQGLGNEVPLTSAQATLAQAETAFTTARTHTLQLAAKLAYSTGQLLSFGPFIPRPAGANP